MNVALLPEGADPDAFVRRNGGRAYADLLTNSRPYLEFLLDRAASKHDVQKPGGPAGVPERHAGGGRHDSGRRRNAISLPIDWRTRRG